MADLIARLREAIDKTEQIARAAVGFDYGVKDWADDGDPVNVHIARHDPASVLRMVAAHRKILELHACAPYRYQWEAERGICRECEDVEWPCPTVLALAEAYDLTPPPAA